MGHQEQKYGSPRGACDGSCSIPPNNGSLCSATQVRTGPCASRSLVQAGQYRGATAIGALENRAPLWRDLLGDVGTESALSRHQVEILRKCTDDTAIGDLMSVAGRADRTKFRNQILRPLLRAELLRMTIPEKPNSRLQKYHVTPKGRAWLAARENDAE